MIKFSGKILQFGFGAVGKSFFELVQREIKFDKKNYFVISKNAGEMDAFLELGGTANNFIERSVTKENFEDLFSKYLSRGDLFVDFSEGTGTREICTFCAKNNIMYLNTGESEWPGGWVNFYEHNLAIRSMIDEISGINGINLHPIVLQHGNNPGLVSHFVKIAIERIAKAKKNKEALKAVKQNKFGIAAKILKVRTIHINDIDSQIIDAPAIKDKLYTTWCAENFLYEMLTHSAFSIGVHEGEISERQVGHIELDRLAVDTKCLTHYCGGQFEGYVVPHEETISIAKHLEVAKKSGEVIYRPRVMFVYKPSNVAEEYLFKSKVYDYPNSDKEKEKDHIDEYENFIIRGRKFPKDWEIVYDQIVSGTEYVGVLVVGDDFNPVWVGNRIELAFLYKKLHNKGLYWQTPTITPVAASALAAVCFMIKKNQKGGIYFPDDILDYKSIVKLAEKYISKTLVKTFNKDEIDIKAINKVKHTT
ncbi:MAG: saccharopine dehydrogenase NADP-binding domain-containing protein [Firmicutes bacterium]|nr:saccharopine dehydrogenase NADP-binding domain-containing protein [Bacillota bacterium]